MSDYAWWIANLMQPDADYNFEFAQEGLDTSAKVQNVAKKTQSGKSLEPDEYPTVLKLSQEGHSGERVLWPCNPENIPSIFKIWGLWFISRGLREAILKFNTFEGEFQQVRLLDREGYEIEKETWFINPRNLKKSFSPFKSDAVMMRLTGFGLRPDQIMSENASFYAYNDDDILLHGSATTVADIWVEAFYLGTFFVSHSLYEYLVSRPEFSDIKFIRSPIVTSHSATSACPWPQ